MSTLPRSSRALYAVAVLGIAAGAMVGFGISAVRARGDGRDPAAVPGHPDRAAEAGDVTPRYAAVRERAARTAIAAAPRAEEASPRAEPPPAPPPPTAAQMLAWHETEVEKHYRQSADPAWAPGATKAFAEDFTVAVQQLGASFTVERMDCRFDTCVAALRWPSRRQAHDEWSQVLHFPFRAGCGRRIILPEPAPDGSDTAAPVQANVLFDCSAMKSTPIPQQPLAAPLAVSRPTVSAPAPQ